MHSSWRSLPLARGTVVVVSKLAAPSLIAFASMGSDDNPAATLRTCRSGSPTGWERSPQRLATGKGRSTYCFASPKLFYGSPSRANASRRLLPLDARILPRALGIAVHLSGNRSSRIPWSASSAITAASYAPSIATRALGVSRRSFRALYPHILLRARRRSTPAQHGQSSQGAMDATSHSSSVAAQRRPSGRRECRCRSSNPHRLRTSPPSQRLADLEGSAHRSGTPIRTSTHRSGSPIRAGGSSQWSWPCIRWSTHGRGVRDRD
jgi:hypothetical protein